MSAAGTTSKAGDNKLTPAMRQHQRFKEAHPDCILLFRMGDFYELFGDDAVTASKALGLTLTQRTEGVPMAGVPYHQLDNYLKRLVDQGYRVAVADQVQDPKDAKGVVDRAVTRVFTQGTLVDDALLKDGAPTRLAGVCIPSPEPVAVLAVVDPASGAFTVTRAGLDVLGDELMRRGVAEVLIPDDATRQSLERALSLKPGEVRSPTGIAVTPRPSWQFRQEEALEAIRDQYAVASTDGFGLSPKDTSIRAAGALVRYLRETQAPHDPNEGDAKGRGKVRPLAHLRPPQIELDDRACILDGTSLRALEVERTIRSQQLDGSLLGIFIPACRTPMGRRLLADWLRRPLGDLERIGARQRCVSALAEDRTLAGELADRLEGVQDIARIAARIAIGRASPRDLVALGQSLARLDELRAQLDSADAFAEHLARLTEIKDELAPLAVRIIETCVESPPSHLRDGGLIRDGVDAELDEARSLQRDAGQWLSDYQVKLNQEHDLPSLKVGYNRVFGYYIELPAAQARRAPDTFTRKQTLKNAERYITPELKDFEDKVSTAEARALEREKRLFDELCGQAALRVSHIQTFADTVSELDVLLCFADKAAKRGWIKPELTEKAILRIKQGRHPVLDEKLSQRVGDTDFVPNDAALACALDAEDTSGDSPSAKAALALITGPNMAGKSTFIRQTALLVLLAHTGSFIPAESATIGLTDRIFTRVGADDALHAGQSTFMVEMTETAAILNAVTDRSLVILDEIGRGTSTLDGLSLAWAVGEALASGLNGAGLSGIGGPRTLFATHYHELTELEERLPGRVRNLHVAVREWGDEIVFIHRIRPGRTDRSYGIHVAKLAGVPAKIVARADEVLKSLEVQHAAPPDGRAGAPNPPPPLPDPQLVLFGAAPHPAVNELRELKLDALTPLQAFDELRRLKSMTD